LSCWPSAYQLFYLFIYLSDILPWPECITIKLICKNLISNMISLIGGAFRWWLNYGGSALMNRICPLIKDTGWEELPFEDTAMSQHLWIRESTLLRHWICKWIDRGLPTLLDYEKRISVVYKLSHRKCFVIVTIVDCHIPLLTIHIIPHITITISIVLCSLAIPDTILMVSFIIVIAQTWSWQQALLHEPLFFHDCFYFK
jgi:hypothetical protein